MRLRRRRRRDKYAVPYPPTLFLTMVQQADAVTAFPTFTMISGLHHYNKRLLLTLSNASKLYILALYATEDASDCTNTVSRRRKRQGAVESNKQRCYSAALRRKVRALVTLCDALRVERKARDGCDRLGRSYSLFCRLSFLCMSRRRAYISH